MRQYNVNNSQPEHKFWLIQEVISTSLVVDNTCGGTIMCDSMIFHENMDKILKNYQK